MQVEVSEEAAGLVRAGGGSLWVWASRPRACCGGTPIRLAASTTPPPPGQAGFTTFESGGLRVLFRPPGGRFPEVLQIGLRGRRQPKVEAYWDGCLFVM